MTLAKQPHAEPIPGYRLVEFLGRGGFGEVWKCEVPGGLFKAIKFVPGNLNPAENEDTPAKQELQALECVKAIRHPFLLSMDRIEVVDGELVIVMELADRNLNEVFRAYRAAGLPGIPPEELLSYMVEVAEALDLMNLEHRLQHLDIKPGNLFLVNRHVKVGDFGLVSSLGEVSGLWHGEQINGLTPLYCAPESLDGVVSSRSDQYSLAVVYLELRTGCRPYHATEISTLLIQRATREPDLSALLDAEQPIVSQAMARDPHYRFPSCTDFVKTLKTAGAAAGAGLVGTTPVSPLARPKDIAPAPNSGNHSATKRLGRPRSTPAPRSGPREPSTPDRLPGYRFLEGLSQHALWEVWLAETPDHRQQLVKFIRGFSDWNDPEALKSLQRFRSLAHPVLAANEIAYRDGAQLVLTSAPASNTAWQRFQECQLKGLVGIPRKELLSYLEPAADGLDSLYKDHGIRHLLLNPHTLLLDQERLLVADFGLADLFWLPAGQFQTVVNPRYSAPELLDNQANSTCDQFSLALIYHHLLTGTHPYPSHSVHRLRKNGWKIKLDHGGLSSGDLGILSQALHLDPKQRFGSNAEMVKALIGPIQSKSAPVKKPRLSLPSVIPFTQPLAIPDSSGSLPSLGEVVVGLFEKAAGSLKIHSAKELRYVLEPGVLLQQTFGIREHPALAKQKLPGFRDLWKASLVWEEELSCRLRVPITASFWERCLSRHSQLEMEVRLAPARTPDATLQTEVAVGIRPLAGDAPPNRTLLDRIGPQLLQSLREVFPLAKERRQTARIPFPQPVQVFPVPDSLGPVDAIAGQGKDISMTGMALLLPEEVRTRDVYVHCGLTPQAEGVAFRARVKRSHRHADDTVEVGLIFVGASS